MELSFSQRMGYKPVKSVLQIDEIDSELEVALWNVVIDNIQDFLLTPVDKPGTYNKQWSAQQFAQGIWVDFFKKTSDTFPLIYDSSSVKSYFKQIKEEFFKFEWYEVYDFLEFLAKTHPDKTYAKMFIENCNRVLERELSAYRFAGKTLVQVTSDQEIAEISEAVDISKTYTLHLERALNLLADRKSPDYANSIKESISAVEATCRLITGDPKVTLGTALGKLESKGIVLHENLKDGFKKIYWYTSDAHGIRHGLLGKADLDVEDAKFMLIACSAFINYLVAKAVKAGIKLTKSKRRVVQ